MRARDFGRRFKTHKCYLELKSQTATFSSIVFNINTFFANKWNCGRMLVLEPFRCVSTCSSSLEMSWYWRLINTLIALVAAVHFWNCEFFFQCRVSVSSTQVLANIALNSVRVWMLKRQLVNTTLVQSEQHCLNSRVCQSRQNMFILFNKIHLFYPLF